VTESRFGREGAEGVGTEGGRKGERKSKRGHAGGWTFSAPKTESRVGGRRPEHKKTQGKWFSVLKLSLTIPIV